MSNRRCPRCRERSEHLLDIYCPCCGTRLVPVRAVWRDRSKPYRLDE